MTLTEIGGRAKNAAFYLASASSADKDEALLAIAGALEDEEIIAGIIAANDIDMAAAEKNSMSEALKDRLRLTEARIKAIAAAVRGCAALPDPVGLILGGGPQPNGLMISRVSVPLGVVGVIFEARPNVCVDCAALCLKSGNAAILRGGKEAVNSNMALAAAMRKALAGTKIPPDAIQLIEDTGRETATEMMRLNGYIDVLIPRGGAGLISSVVKNSTVPVIETGVGNCHAFVDESADIDMAVSIVDNAKTSRPGVCNALESLLVHRAAAKAFLPAVKAVLDKHNVQLRGCPETQEILGDSVILATEEDYHAEFYDYILSVKIVADVKEAVSHIREYSTGHSETIITRDLNNAEYFTKSVDSAAVYVNASTRFTDGGEFGLGAEIGISTQKLHARGPMGLKELTSYKYIINGNGQIR